MRPIVSKALIYLLLPPLLPPRMLVQTSFVFNILDGLLNLGVGGRIWSNALTLHTKIHTGTACSLGFMDNDVESPFELQGR